MRALGGRGKHIKICLCLAQSIIFFELSRPVTEATEFQTTTKRREEAPRLAARTEKRTTPKNHKCYNTNVHFVVCSGEAKPKISFPFFVGSPHTPRRKSKRKEGKFLVFAPATEGSGRGAHHWSFRLKKVRAKDTISPKPKPKQEPTTELGLLIRNRREELGLTIETFAKKLKISLAQAKCLETRIAERMKYKLFEPLLRVLELKPSDLGRFVGWTKNESLTSLGQVIRSRRKELGFSLASLGQKLGITRERVRQIENNRSSFSNKGNKLKKIAKILNLNFSELQALQPARRFKRGKIGTDTFGGFLTARRVELHLTQYELAERVGISPNTICATELGKFVPNSDMLGKMATALDCVIPSQLILIPRKRGRPRKDLINS